MKDQVFRAETILPRDRKEVFDFFSDPANLERITPPWLRFRILTPPPLPRVRRDVARIFRHRARILDELLSAEALR